MRKLIDERACLHVEHVASGIKFNVFFMMLGTGGNTTHGIFSKDLDGKRLGRFQTNLRTCKNESPLLDVMHAANCCRVRPAAYGK